ncbi:MAG: hypothetical protein VB080_12885 [Propionicimonas sp.]|uniref:hypothetical protein n=1 Tax=Propionicimonas sp. TaxID=1955623 RepID=UPI002B21D556|nr:hypothetical protein [Propionicimonas sp.]MEA4945317.1 hypothetical protein [Propionicimonas sp.]
MVANRRSWWKRPALWIVAAVVVIAGIGVAVAVTVANRPVAEGPVAPSPTPTPSATPTATDEEIPEGLASELEPSEPAPTADLPYCEKFRTIIAGGTDVGSENRAENLKELAAKYEEYLDKYAEAAALAPDSLTDEYDTVISYLKEAIAVVKGGDFTKIMAKFEELETLNTAMAAINDQSRAYCS